eukprot:2431431-Rhodomonas_salina.1
MAARQLTEPLEASDGAWSMGADLVEPLALSQRSRRLAQARAEVGGSQGSRAGTRGIAVARRRREVSGRGCEARSRRDGG